MAGRPLRPAIDRRLGGPLPRQQANQSSAAPSAPGLAVPGFHPQVLCGISQPFGWLSPTNGHVPMYYSPVRHSPPGASSRAAVRLACVRHAASVQSEPGSNSLVQSLFCRSYFAGIEREELNSFLSALISANFVKFLSLRNREIPPLLRSSSSFPMFTLIGSLNLIFKELRCCLSNEGLKSYRSRFLLSRAFLNFFPRRLAGSALKREPSHK